MGNKHIVVVVLLSVLYSVTVGLPIKVSETQPLSSFAIDMRHSQTHTNKKTARNTRVLIVYRVLFTRVHKHDYGLRARPGGVSHVRGVIWL